MFTDLLHSHYRVKHTLFILLFLIIGYFILKSFIQQRGSEIVGSALTGCDRWFTRAGAKSHDLCTGHIQLKLCPTDSKHSRDLQTDATNPNRMWRPAAHSEEEDKVTGRRAEEEPSGADREALLFSKWPTVHELNVSSLSSTAAVGGLKNKNCSALPYCSFLQ